MPLLDFNKIRIQKGGVMPESKNEFVGMLHAWAETGTEGLVWTLQRDGVSFYEGMVIVEGGDQLTIYGENGEVLFDGDIEPDYKAGLTEYPRNPGNSQPAALGFWIHWTQKGFTPDDWALFFVRDWQPGKEPYRAKLVKRQQADC